MALKQVVVQGHTFSVDSRYKPQTILGRGSFGVVCTALDTVTNKNIAIKRIRPYANDDWDARHTLREIRLMKLFKSHPNIISLYNLTTFDEKSELYMMMELMDCDLHRIIQSKQELSDAHIKCFAKQLLEGIKALHSVGVFHRDIKPGNILVSKDCQLRITDFGLARFMDEQTLSGDNQRNPMTEYVVTRWYRCPELLLAPNRPYTAAVDIWSIGCILVELMRRKPLFPGKSHTHQVQLILEVRGYSNPEDLGFPLSAETKSFLNRRCKFAGQSLTHFVPGASRDSLELIESFLKLDPTARPSAEEALEFKYLQGAQEVNDYSSVSITPPARNQFTFETEKFSLAELNAMVREEIESYQSGKNDGEKAVVYTLEGTIVDVNKTDKPTDLNATVDRVRAKSNPSSTGERGEEEEEDEFEEPVTVNRARSKFSEMMSSNTLSRPSSGNTRFDGGERDDDDNSLSKDKADSYLPKVSAASKIRDLKAAVRQGGGASFLSRSILPGRSGDKTGKEVIVNTNMNSTAPVQPSPKKIESIIERDRKIKRKFFLQSLLQTNSTTTSSSSSKSNPYSSSSAKANTDAISSIRGRSVSESGSTTVAKNRNPSIISAIRGSLGIGKIKQPLFHGAVPIPK